MSQTEKALLPCPFCGGEAEFDRIGTSRQSCIVVCTNCGARHESGDQDGHSGSSWNRRAALSLPQTQGEPVAWMYVWPKNNLPYLTRHIYDERLSVEARAARAAVGVKEFPLYAAPPSQPAQGEPVAWMNTAGRVISAKEKINAVQLISEGGEFEIAGKAALSYSIRLGVIK